MVVGPRDLSSHHGKNKSSFTRDKEPFQSTLAAVRGWVHSCGFRKHHLLNEWIDKLAVLQQREAAYLR